MMTIDFMIGAIRASRDLHPSVMTAVEEILHKEDEMLSEPSGDIFDVIHYCGKCHEELLKHNSYCPGCGQAVRWE